MSGFTRTPNLALYKPTPNADNDAWGGHLNANADVLDALLGSGGAATGPWLPLSGGTVTGYTCINAMLQANVLFTGQNTWTPANSALQPIIDSRANLAGVVNGVSEMQRFIVTTDTMDARAGDNGCYSDLGIYHSVAGSTVNGGRHTIWAQLNVGALTPPGLQMNGIGTTIFANANTNGALCQPLATSVVVGSAASAGSSGAEFMVTAVAGSTISDKYFLQFTYGPGDRVAGTQDTCIRFASANPGGVSSPGAGTLIQLGNYGMGWPVNPGGTILGAVLQVANQGSGRNIQFIPTQCVNGINLSPVYFTGNAFASPSFSVNGVGDIRSGNMQIAKTGTGVSIDINQQIVSAAAVAVGGIGTGAGTNDFYVGDTVSDAYGGIYSVTTVAAGKITGLAVRVRATSVSPPANPVPLSGGSGVGATVNLTWSATTNTLALNPSGGPATFGGSVTFANGIKLDNLGASATDLSKHIQLYPGYGMNAAASRLNVVTAQATYFISNAVEAASIWSDGLHLTGGFSVWQTTLGANLTSKPIVTGSKGANAALASLLTALASYGLVQDSST